MQLFYTPKVTTPIYTLPEEESAHAVRVLRMGVGEKIQLTDGRGTMYLAQIVLADARECTVEIIMTMPYYKPVPYSLTIAIAPTKSIDRFENFVEKATETGINRIIPIETEHSERRVVKNEHVEKVMIGAIKQSIKAFLPQLDEVTPLDEVLKMPFTGEKLIAHCNQPVKKMEWVGNFIKKGNPVLILIGPEGDFSPAEVTRAVECGFKEVSLGDARLRTETAGMAAVFAMHFLSR